MKFNQYLNEDTKVHFIKKINQRGALVQSGDDWTACDLCVSDFEDPDKSTTKDPKKVTCKACKRKMGIK